MNMEHNGWTKLASVGTTVAPINRLPLDLLLTLFRDLQPERRHTYGYRIPFEVAMSHVCSRWRDVALASPLLWKDIDAYSFKSFDAVLNYLKRSQGCPVNVRIDIWKSDRNLQPHDGATSIIPLVDLLTEHATRWKTLLVFTHHRTTTNAILSCMKDLITPLLERVRIVDDYGGADPHTSESLSDQTSPTNPQFFLGGAPKLVVFHTNNLRQTPPLANVTTLHLRTSYSPSSFDIQPHVLADLASVCPSLSTLSIHGNFSEHWAVDKVIMPGLKSLWFSNEDIFAAKFLTTVDLPNLNSLWLDCPQNQIVNEIYDHHPRPCFPSLKYLTLQSFDYYASTRFSRIFPTIEALRVAYCNSFHVTFLKETLVDDDMARWGSLRHLVFQTTRESHAVKFSKILHELVTERHDKGRPILRVLLDSDLLAALTTASSVRTHTSLEELCGDNYDDPLWILSHRDEER